MVIFRLFDEQLLVGFFAKPPELGFFFISLTVFDILHKY